MVSPPTLDSTMEVIRARLKKSQPTWGAHPPTSSKTIRTDHGPPDPQPPPDSETLSAEDLSSQLLDATVADIVKERMDSRDEHSQQEQKSFVTTEGWTLDTLLARSQSFRSVRRIPASLPPKQLEAQIAKYEEDSDGTPLIIEGWHKHENWPREFTADWLHEHCPQDISVRNVRDWSDRKVPLATFIDSSRSVSPCAVADETERLYGKDVECPTEWRSWLDNSGVLPSGLLPEGPNNLMQHLPESERVKTLMCYFGIGDTFTPAHKDLCASSGQNLMCYTENSGSSFWFMTAGSSTPEVAQYFHDIDQELDLETHVITLEELAKAPFTVYIAEQKLGDLVLVPPRSCHQVVNYGGLTIKTSWSRMTAKGLGTALYHELPIYRRVCRPETYRVKSTIHQSLLHYTEKLELSMHPYHEESGREGSSSSSSLVRSRTITPEFRSRFPVSSSRDALRTPTPSSSMSLSATETQEREHSRSVLQHLVKLFDEVLAEDFHTNHLRLAHTPEPSAAPVCDFCGSDVFQSFFECRSCVDSPPPNEAAANQLGTDNLEIAEELILCPSCYVEGRICKCESMTAVQRYPFQQLLRDRNRAMEVLFDLRSEGKSGNTRSNFVPLREDTLLSSGDRLPVFEAACILQKSRIDAQGKKETRMCTLRTLKTSHPVFYTSLIGCKKCHSGLCFEHILDLGIHSAAALLESDKDITDEAWHAHHQASKARFNSDKRKVLEAEKKGDYWRLHDRLVLVASNFVTCKPLNQKFTKPGFYDKYIQTSNLPMSDSDKVNVDDSIVYAASDPPPRSPSTERDDMPIVQSDSISTVDDLENLPPSTEQRVPIVQNVSGPPSVADASLEPPTSSGTTASVPDADVAPLVLSGQEKKEKRRRPRVIFDFVDMPPLRPFNKKRSLGAVSEPTTELGPFVVQQNTSRPATEHTEDTDMESSSLSSDDASGNYTISLQPLRKKQKLSVSSVSKATTARARKVASRDAHISSQEPNSNVIQTFQEDLAKTISGESRNRTAAKASQAKAPRISSGRGITVSQPNDTATTSTTPSQQKQPMSNAGRKVGHKPIPISYPATQAVSAGITNASSASPSLATGQFSVPALHDPRRPAIAKQSLAGTRHGEIGERVSSTKSKKTQPCSSSSSVSSGASTTDTSRIRPQRTTVASLSRMSPDSQRSSVVSENRQLSDVPKPTSPQVIPGSSNEYKARIASLERDLRVAQDKIRDLETTRQIPSASTAVSWDHSDPSTVPSEEPPTVIHTLRKELRNTEERLRTSQNKVELLERDHHSLQQQLSELSRDLRSTQRQLSDIGQRPNLDNGSTGRESQLSQLLDMKFSMFQSSQEYWRFGLQQDQRSFVQNMRDNFQHPPPNQIVLHAEAPYHLLGNPFEPQQSEGFPRSGNNMRAPYRGGFRGKQHRGQNAYSGRSHPNFDRGDRWRNNSRDYPSEAVPSSSNAIPVHRHAGANGNYTGMGRKRTRWDDGSRPPPKAPMAYNEGKTGDASTRKRADEGSSECGDHGPVGNGANVSTSLGRAAERASTTILRDDLVDDPEERNATGNDVTMVDHSESGSFSGAMTPPREESSIGHGDKETSYSRRHSEDWEDTYDQDDQDDSSPTLRSVFNATSEKKSTSTLRSHHAESLVDNPWSTS